MNEKKENIIQKKTFAFAVRIVKLYKFLVSKKELVLSKQLLRSGTSVGANIREAINAESRADFIHKLSISQKEISETIYWLDLLFSTEFLKEKEYVSIKNDADEVIKIIKSIIITTKRNTKRHS